MRALSLAVVPDEANGLVVAFTATARPARRRVLAQTSAEPHTSPAAPPHDPPLQLGSCSRPQKGH
jgi:hypothetical protein